MSRGFGASALQRRFFGLVDVDHPALDPDSAFRLEPRQPFGNIPPAEAEECYYAMLDEPAMAA